MNYDKEWYDSLVKPKFQPPAWVFAPVWSVLYFLMAVSFILVVTSKFHWFSIFAYMFFAAQIIVNLSWTPIFFEQHNLRRAFGVCALLTLLVFITMILFYNISKLAGILFLPYFLWSIFATVLSFEILELNEW